MERLPDELITEVLEYLEPSDLATLQRVSRHLLKLGRDNPLWRFKCYSSSPSSASQRPTYSSALAALTPFLPPRVNPDGLQENVTQTWHGSFPGVVSNPPDLRRRSKKARLTADWDFTHVTENIDWYSEYISRHASLSLTWLDHESTSTPEIRGMCFMEQEQKALGPLEDGSLCIWDISEKQSGRSQGHRTFRELARASPGSMFTNYALTGEPSKSPGRLSFSGVGECVSVDPVRQRAYIAVADRLNEVDLNSFRVVSQSKYAWPITALSQDNVPDQPLTVGTTWSLHFHDPRLPNRDRSRSPEDSTKLCSKDPEESIAFLPNFFKPGHSVPRPDLTRNPRFSMRSPPPESGFYNVNFDSSQPPPRHSDNRPDLSVYAQCEPGPLSILHHGPASIFIAGRFPSILSYDRRYFPRLEYAIHSGARLSSMASIPYPPRGSANSEAILLACGEYSGRGSLELYSLPHLKPNQRADVNPSEGGLVESVNEINDHDHLHSYRNRQTASSAKLLSVATHGTRIVFSDAEGGLKWVERDGSSLVRRWNINDYSLEQNQLEGSRSLNAQPTGEHVVRKIIPLPPFESPDNGRRGDGDLLIWTGERAGIVTLKPMMERQDDLEHSFGNNSTKPQSETDDDRAEEYGRIMRTAFERQTDEINWMRRFGMRP